MSSAESDIVLQITKNLGNMNSILQDGLTTSYTDATDTLTSVAQLNKFYRLTRRGLCPPMSNALRCIHAWKNHPVCGQILCERLLTSIFTPISNPDMSIAFGNDFFDNATPLQQGKQAEHIIVD
jgi:hypothetical protein